jgi:predicted patatin/cPLA2 family phospholipase
MYLLTCEHINICGIFELPDPYIILESKLTQEQLDKAKKELQDMNKVIFEDSWIFVVNARKNNNYENSEDNKKCLLKELERVPQNIKELFNKYSPYSSVDSSVDSSPKSTNKQETINNKSEIRTHKQETINGKEDMSKELEEARKALADKLHWKN